MFQDFSAPKEKVTGPNRLNSIRAWMHERNLDAVLVPHADEQRNEYLPACAERLAWLSGFTGSAGEAIVTADHAILFVDGRYTLQAADQTDPEFWEIESLIDTPPVTWLRNTMKKGTRIGFDPWLHTANEVKQFRKAAEALEGEAVSLENNPVDTVWSDRPAPPKGAVKIHDLTYSGAATSEKLETLNASLAENQADLCVLTDPSSICWLFNIRGSDVAHTPIVLAHAILQSGELPLLFIDMDKVDMETHAFLNQAAHLKDPHQLESTLEELALNKRVMLDPNLAPYALFNCVETNGGTVVATRDPVSLPRATKNRTEIAGSRAAHRRDGAAMTTYLAWLDAQKPGTIDEIAAAKKLEETRQTMAGNLPLMDISFDTISGSGPNGAIVHYRVNEDTNRTLQTGELYLTDSGGQYPDGTTDITRTVVVGEPDPAHRRAYTLVLRGHIAIARARFPKGSRGVDLDALARAPLWQNGLDYAHGTGHGVGSYLSVHEGPQSLSKRGMQELLPGMIISNEPGYYRKDAFGIRLENLVLVREADDIFGGEIPMMGFETLTLAPFDRRLIDPTLMSDDELHWLNAYHGHVRLMLEPLLEGNALDWMRKATEPMSKEANAS